MTGRAAKGTSAKRRKGPVCSLAALCCALLLPGLVYFLTLPEGRAFNEQVFGRYFTAGAIGMMGMYALACIGLAVLGVTLAAAALVRREWPTWLARLALVASILSPIALVILAGNH